MHFLLINVGLPEITLVYTLGPLEGLPTKSGQEKKPEALQCQTGLYQTYIIGNKVKLDMITKTMFSV